MKEQNRISTLVNSRFYPLLLFFISFVFVTLFSRSTSFLYVFEGGDPSIFKQMGRAVLRGKILYIDYFDNKGCLLYFIHALGIWLGGNTILLLMQACSLTFTLLIWDKMLALCRDERGRILGLAIGLFLLLCFYGAGDQTQEWCLPFISYPLLVYFRAYKTKTVVKPVQMFLIGLCFGVITFIQVNNACAFLGFVAWLWIQYLVKKDYKKLFSSILHFLFGWLVVAIPCVLYFYIVAGGHGVYEMVYASFLSNFEYIGNQWKTRWIHIIPYSLFLLSFLVFQIVNYHKDKDILIPIVISICLFVGTFGRLCNSFYLSAIIPLCVINVMTSGFSEKRVTKIVLCILMGISLIFYLGNTAKDLVFQNTIQQTIYEGFHHCTENIPENERDSIYNYNLYWHGASMMEHEDLLACNRVLFTSLVFTLPTLWKEETSKPTSPPKWMMVSFNKPYIKEDAIFIMKHYDLVCSFQYNNLYFEKPRIGETFEVGLYRRKDTTQ